MGQSSQPTLRTIPRNLKLPTPVTWSNIHLLTQHPHTESWWTPFSFCKTILPVIPDHPSMDLIFLPFLLSPPPDYLQTTIIFLISWPEFPYLDLTPNPNIYFFGKTQLQTKMSDLLVSFQSHCWPSLCHTLYCLLFIFNIKPLTEPGIQTLTSWADFSASPLRPFFSFFFRKISWSCGRERGMSTDASFANLKLLICFRRSTVPKYPTELRTIASLDLIVSKALVTFLVTLVGKSIK